MTAGLPTADEISPRRVVGYTVDVSDSYTRPADTTQYTADDAVSDSTSAPTVLEFVDVVREAGGSGILQAARLMKSTKASTAGLFELWLLKAAPAGLEDNAAFDLSDSENENVVAVFTFSLRHYGSNNSFYLADEQGIPFVCGAAETSLYGVVKALNAYTPASAETFTFGLTVLQD